MAIDYQENCGSKASLKIQPGAYRVYQQKLGSPRLLFKPARNGLSLVEREYFEIVEDTELNLRETDIDLLQANFPHIIIATDDFLIDCEYEKFLAKFRNPGMLKFSSIVAEEIKKFRDFRQKCLEKVLSECEYDADRVFQALTHAFSEEITNAEHIFMKLMGGDDSSCEETAPDRKVYFDSGHPTAKGHYDLVFSERPDDDDEYDNEENNEPDFFVCANTSDPEEAYHFAFTENICPSCGAPLHDVPDESAMYASFLGGVASTLFKKPRD